MSENKEKIIYKGRPSWLYYFYLYVIVIILFAVLNELGNTLKGIILLLVTFLIIAILRYRHQFTISNNWIIMRVGLIARNTNEMKIRHIRSMKVRQNPLERILGIGTLIAISAADGESAVTFKGIRDPHGVKEKIMGLEISG